MVDVALPVHCVVQLVLSFVPAEGALRRLFRYESVFVRVTFNIKLQLFVTVDCLETSLLHW